MQTSMMMVMTHRPQNSLSFVFVVGQIFVFLSSIVVVMTQFVHCISHPIQDPLFHLDHWLLEPSEFTENQMHFQKKNT